MLLTHHLLRETEGTLKGGRPDELVNHAMADLCRPLRSGGHSPSPNHRGRRVSPRECRRAGRLGHAAGLGFASTRGKRMRTTPPPSGLFAISSEERPGESISSLRLVFFRPMPLENA